MSDTNIQQIFRNGWQNYCGRFNPSDDQYKAAWCIIACKTGELDYNISCYEECGHIDFHANYCRNHNCPNCQAVLRELRIDKRRSEVIDASYYHVVFTIPAGLNPLVYSKQKLHRNTFGIIPEQKVSRCNTWDHSGTSYLGTGAELSSTYPLYHFRRRTDKNKGFKTKRQKVFYTNGLNFMTYFTRPAGIPKSKKLLTGMAMP